MKTTVEHTTKIVDGKEYNVKITRQSGLQEVLINGMPTLVEKATFIEWPGKMGTTQNYTIVRVSKAQEEKDVFLSRVREAATLGLISQGIW